MKILGVFLCLGFIFSGYTLAECGQSSEPLLRVTKVIDGDTLRLEDGRSVRIIGINAPEISRKGKPGQALGVEARRAAQAFVDKASGKIRLGYELERQDHYGRELAHVYDARGQSMAVSLLHQGMAFPIAIPPNINQSRCLFAAQDKARSQRVGVWGHTAWQPLSSIRLSLGDRGFQRVRGRVEKVTINSSIWLELEGKLVVRIAKEDWRHFPQKPADWQKFKGVTLEIQGWITPQHSRNKNFKPLVMGVRSPLSMQVISP